LFGRAAAEFGDVVYRHFPNPPPAGQDQTVAELALRELNKLRHLSVGQPALEIDGQDAEGDRFKLSDYRGKVVVLTFSGNWCGPCRGMYPEERKLVERLRGEPFALLSVNTDEDRQTLRKSIKEGEITWRCWWDGGTDGPIRKSWGIDSFPTVLVLDKEGVIRFKGVRGERLDKAVEALLKPAKSPDR
jgi:thiol-disulfide isomerase/thioredoxin